MKETHYLIYQITNLVNGKIYIGKHKTRNIEDKYFGSGRILARAKQKYGLENFVFKILIDLSSETEMNLLERLVVTEDFCKRPDTYNLMPGGNGGWTYVNKNCISKEEDLRRKSKGGKISQKKCKEIYGISVSEFIVRQMTPAKYQQYLKKKVRL